MEVVMGDTMKITFEVETIESGQRRRYGDSYFHYKVTSTQDADTVKRYCTKVLRPSISYEQYQKDQKENATMDNHFRNYHTILKVLHSSSFMDDKPSVVEYKVVSPSTH